jgi:hypothetical protein
MTEIQQVRGEHGEHWDVSEDDGVELVKLMYVDGNDEKAHFIMPREAAAMYATAIRRFLKNTEPKVDGKSEAKEE